MLNVFKFIKSVEVWKFDMESLCYRLGLPMSQICKVSVSVDAMIELGVLVRDENGFIMLPENSVKVDLGSSSLLSGLKQ